MLAIREAWDRFQRLLETDTPLPRVEVDTVQREAAIRAEAAQAYVQAKEAAQAANEAPDRAKEALVAVAEPPREQGAGVTVTRFAKAGSVDYEKVAELRGVDREAYRGKWPEGVSVTTS